MGKKYYVLVGLVIIAGVLISFNTLNKTTSVADTDDSLVTLVSNDGEETKWYSFNEAVELNAKNGKKLFVDVYTNWCGPCKWLDKNTLSHPGIQKIMDEYFIPVKFNAEGNDTISFDGKVFVNKNPNAAARMSTHEFTPYIASTPQGVAYPTMVFFNNELELIQPITGALRPRQLEPILVFIGGDHYLSTPWEDFVAEYQYTIPE